jgi:hypothetical protein
MERSNIKTLIIIILLLINLFLIVNLTTNNAYSESVKPEDIENLSSLLSELEVELEKDALPPKVIRTRSLEVRRDEKKERQIAERLLGSVQTEELGGGLVKYFSDSGSAVFRQDFDFKIEFKRESMAYQTIEEARKELTVLFSEAGFEIETVETSHEEDALVFSSVQKIERLPVRNLSITIRLHSEGRISASGRWVFTYGGSPDEKASMSAVSLVLPFANGAKAKGYDLGSIERISYCYYLNQAADGGFEIIPACLFETDAGSFCVDSRRFAFIELPELEGQAG